ncbi:hypothetical protein ACFSUK_08000 [Sphingobium scionense]
MRPETIHPMGCECGSCNAPRRHPLYQQPVVDPRDIDAARKGLIAGLWVGGILTASKFGPSIIDWMTSR